jgi:hypothetical protein
MRAVVLALLIAAGCTSEIEQQCQRALDAWESGANAQAREAGAGLEPAAAESLIATAGREIRELKPRFLELCRKAPEETRACLEWALNPDPKCEGAKKSFNDNLVAQPTPPRGLPAEAK